MQKCLICNNEMEFYFQKTFEDYKNILEKADYYKCKHCGFVFSDSHAKLTQEKYEELNKKYCDYSFLQNIDNYEHRPPYLQQALLINILHKQGIIGKNWLDFGCGTKFFEEILKNNFDLNIDGYDKYLDNSFIPKTDKYDLVFSGAVLEHITTADTIDEMVSYLNKDGILMFHTLVCENIPQNPDWFYLLPVHSAFFTNKSMTVLMNKYGFTSSTYCPAAKTWILFRHNPNIIETKINSINKSVLNNYLIFKSGFVDYWKGF